MVGGRFHWWCVGQGGWAGLSAFETGALVWGAVLSGCGAGFFAKAGETPNEDVGRNCSIK